jgi:hypothetical protein
VGPPTTASGAMRADDVEDEDECAVASMDEAGGRRGG